jgi:signal peptidase I
MSAEPDTERIPVVAPATKPHPVRRVGGWIGAAALLLVVGIAVAVAVVPAVAGATPLTVLTGSMVPTLPVGSTVIVRPRPVSEIHAGDIITFTDREEGTTATRVVTHRVVEVLPGPAFRTKGDANNAADVRPVAAADVHGVLWYDVPLVGWLKDRLISWAGLFLALGVALLVVAAQFLLPDTPTRGKQRS